MFEDESEEQIITDFDDGVDAIEFLIDAFGFDDIDVLREQEGESLQLSVSDGSIQLFDVNAAGLEDTGFLFRTERDKNSDASVE